MPSPPPILFTNTMGHRLEQFQPLQPGRAHMYTCGPTVQRRIHIGNFRSFLLGDLLRRVLEYNGYEVVHARNITDVGHLTNETLSIGLDRIEAEAREQNKTPWDIANHFIRLFKSDAQSLNLLEPNFEPRATEFVEPMIELIEKLIERGYGYAGNGDVYYSVDKFPAYGQLSGNSVEELVGGARVEVGEGKKSDADFALWRGASPDKIMRWQSPWGEGVPGWHIECSAMSTTLLGEQIDIHTGGEDNIFPHHEDEIAQSEAATGKKFVRYWLHSAFLLDESGEKMSKSLKNDATLADLEEEGIHPLGYRYFTFQAHYRTPLRLSWEAMEGAQTALSRLWEAAAEMIQSGVTAEPGSSGELFRRRFHEAINRDLDMPGALATLHDALAANLPAPEKLALMSDFDRVLGLDLLAMGRRLSETEEGEQALLNQRAQARERKDWSRSDELRAELTKMGLEVKDTPEGQRWVRKDLLASGARGKPESSSGG